MAATALPLRHRAFRAVMRQRRNARRDWLEELLPLGPDRMQDLTLRLSGGPGEALPQETGDRHGLRAVLPCPAGNDQER